MTPSARRTLLEGLLLTLDGDGAGKSSAVATARAVLAGDDKPRMLLNAPRASQHEIAETAKRVRAALDLKESDTRADNPGSAGCPLPHAKMSKRGKRVCPQCKKPLKIEEALGHESLDRSPKKNWVERAGQLPAAIQHMAKDIHEERGMPLDQAIPIAISQAKKLAAKGNPKYVKAVAEWEKLKAKNAAKGAAKKLTEQRALEEFWSPQARLAAARARHQHSQSMGHLASTGMHPVSMDAENATRDAFSRNRTHEMPVRNHSRVAAIHADTGEVVHGHLSGLSPAGRLGIQDESGKVHHFQPGTLHAAEPPRAVRPVGPDLSPDFGAGGIHAHERKGAMRRAERSLIEAAPGELEELWSPQARLAAARARKQHGTWMRKPGSNYDTNASTNMKTGWSVAGAEKGIKQFTEPHPEDPPHIAKHKEQARALTDKFAKHMKANGLDADIGEVFDKDLPAYAEHLDHVRVHHGLDPVNKKHWAKVDVAGRAGLREAATTTLPKSDEANAEAEKPEGKAKSKPADKPSLEGAGKRVMHLQNRLNELGFDTTTDGKFGPKTAESVKTFQRHAMIKDDGIVGPVTTNALKSAPHSEHVQRANAPDPAPLPDAEVGAGAQAAPQESAAQQRKADDVADAKGITNEQQKTAPVGGADPVPMLMKGAGVGEKKGDSHVRQVQSSLASAGVDINADGRFGPDTEKKVKGFQRKWGLKTDGVVGEKTRRALAHVASKHAKLHEAVAERKQADGAEFGRALAREQVIRRQLEEGLDLEEFWSPQARLAAARARKQHHHSDLGDRLHGPNDWSGRREGEFPGQHMPKEGERAHLVAENGQRAFGTKRGEHVIDDDGAPIRPRIGEIPRGVTDEKGYHANNKAAEDKAYSEIAAKVNSPEGQAAKRKMDAETDEYFAKRKAAFAKKRGLREAKHRGDARKIVEIKRLPNGHFAPKGQGQVLKPGMQVHLGDKVGEVTVEIPNQGLLNKTGKPAVNVEFDDGTQKTVMASNPADAAQGAGTADKHEKGFQDEDGPKSPGSGDLSDSPGRGPTGKLRNFKAMTPTKLVKVIGDLQSYGKDDEALSAIKKVAKEKGVAWGDKPSSGGHKHNVGDVGGWSAAAKLSMPKPSQDSETGLAKSGEGMSANKANLSLKDMPLGTTFEMNDGSQYKLHKAVGDPFYIVKPLDGGKAKPLHKMFAPPMVGPVAEGYEGQDAGMGAAPMAGAAPAMAGVAPPTPGAGDDNDLFGMLSKSVDVAAQAKAQGVKPDFAGAKAAAPPAAAPAAVGAAKLPQEVALEAYLNAGGNDPGVIAALKKQMMQAAQSAEQIASLELREDWAKFDSLRKQHGLGHAMRHTFGMKQPGEGHVDPKEGFREAITSLKPGETMHVPHPDGEMKVTHLGRKGGMHRFQVEGGGAHVDPEMRRGTRVLPGRGAASQEMAERVKGTVHADFEHTAHHTGRVMSAHPGQKVQMESVDGSHAGTIHKSKGKFVAIDHTSGSKSEHDTADGAVRHLKKKMRGKGAQFLEQGHDTDPLSKEKAGQEEKTAAGLKAHDPASGDAVKERLEKYNPDGVAGDLTPDLVADVVKGTPLGATKLTGPSEVGSRFGEAARETAEKAAHRAAEGPRSPGLKHGVADHVTQVVHHAAPHIGHVVHHAHPVIHHVAHLAAARIERERETVKRLEESGDHVALLRARARLRALNERLSTLSA